MPISIHALRVEGDKVLPAATASADQFLSTPSGWRATKEGETFGVMLKISIHALRVEGDGIDMDTIVGYVQFLSTPSGWRATKVLSIRPEDLLISIHALRVEGDFIWRIKSINQLKFLSTPSGWRATIERRILFDRKQDFYPRPPGGGRQVLPAATASADQFLSTPSGWRATESQGRRGRRAEFLSTPSGWRATKATGDAISAVKISIHALRVEGDSRAGGNGHKN